MVDMEIFIDQIADMRVNQMNLILEATRQTILKEHAPEKMICICGRWNWVRYRRTIFTAISFMMIWTALSGYTGSPFERQDHSRPTANTG